VRQYVACQISRIAESADAGLVHKREQRSPTDGNQERDGEGTVDVLTHGIVFAERKEPSKSQPAARIARAELTAPTAAGYSDLLEGGGGSIASWNSDCDLIVRRTIRQVTKVEVESSRRPLERDYIAPIPLHNPCSGQI